MNCTDCGSTTEKLVDGLCRSCRMRKANLKDRYIPLKDLDEKQRSKIEAMRNNSQKYYNKKANDKNNTMETKTEDVNIDDLKNEIFGNLKLAFEKSELDDKIVIENNYDELDSIIKALQVLIKKQVTKDSYEKERENIRKKVDILDKYIIDVLHNLESIDIENTNEQIIEVKKLALLRKIRRELKNLDEITKYTYTLSNLVSNSESRFPKICKEAELFLNSVKYKLYNKIIESPKNDKKLLGLHKYTVTCSVVSSTTNRKIIKVTKQLEGTSNNDVKEKFIEELKTQYGDDVIWSKMSIIFRR